MHTGTILTDGGICIVAIAVRQATTRFGRAHAVVTHRQGGVGTIRVGGTGLFGDALSVPADRPGAGGAVRVAPTLRRLSCAPTALAQRCAGVLTIRVGLAGTRQLFTAPVVALGLARILAMHVERTLRDALTTGTKRLARVGTVGIGRAGSLCLLVGTTAILDVGAFILRRRRRGTSSTTGHQEHEQSKHTKNKTTSPHTTS